MQVIDQIQSTVRALPDKKRYVEFISALLTIPFLTTVIITNVRSMHNQTPTPTPTPTTAQVVVMDQIPTHTPHAVTGSQRVVPSSTPQPTTVRVLGAQEACKKEIGPIEISKPVESQQIGDGPVCIAISQTAAGYCGVAWSYRINGTDWSEYVDKDFCVYGLSGGNKKLEVKVRSIVSQDETILTRNFVVAVAPTLAPTSIATQSGSTTQ